MASGQTMMIFNAQGGVPLGAATAQIDTRNNHLVWDFDAAVAESLDFEGMLSRNYGGAGLTVALVWSATTATTGNVRWQAKFERHQANVTDIDVDDFAAAQAATGAAPATNGARAYTEIAFTDGAQIDNLAYGESFRLRVTRVATDAADTMVGDAELARVEIRET